MESKAGIGSAFRKTPPQPLPTRGRDYPERPPRSSRNVEDLESGCGKLSPSPLWGGVGAGSFIASARDPGTSPPYCGFPFFQTTFWP
ncbi:hypothetical protein ELH50_15240 [Rhizobium ruizarguesonis]|nr:hypothetical protein ELH50_15240 [Rhizobium ruizarguesonis]